MRQGSELFDQDSGYALAVAGDGLALVTLGSTTGGASALVDAGSRDLWNDGFTACSAPSGGYAQIDNPTQAQADNPALAIGDGEVAVAHDSEPEDVMDIGYHYLGAVRFPSRSVSSTLPLSLFPDADENQDDPHLNYPAGTDAHSNDAMVLLSPDIDSEDDRVNETIVLMGATPCRHEGGYDLGPVMRMAFENDALAPAAFNVDGGLGAPDEPPITISGPHWGLPPRARGYGYTLGGGAPEGSLISPAPTVTLVAGTSVPLAAGRSQTSSLSANPLYLATAVVTEDWTDDRGSTSELLIWRSTDLGESWDLLAARLTPWVTSTDDFDLNRTQITDVALAANDTDLWVFWLEIAIPQGSPMPGGLFVTHIDNAAGRTAGNFVNSSSNTTGLSTAVHNFSQDVGSGNVVQLRTTSQATCAPEALDAVFDFAWGDELDGQTVIQDPNDGTPVITYLDNNSDAQAVRVLLRSDGYPLDVIGLPKNLTDAVVPPGNSTDLAISMNHWAPDYQVAEFSILTDFRHVGTGTNAWGRLARTTGSTNTWDSPQEIAPPLNDDTDSRMETDISWRFDGRPRQLLRAETDVESRIATNTEVVAARNPNAQAIATNALDLINTYVADVDVNNLTITRIDP